MEATKLTPSQEAEYARMTALTDENVITWMRMIDVLREKKDSSPEEYATKVTPSQEARYENMAAEHKRIAEAMRKKEAVCTPTHSVEEVQNTRDALASAIERLPEAWYNMEIFQQTQVPKVYNNIVRCKFDPSTAARTVIEDFDAVIARGILEDFGKAVSNNNPVALFDSTKKALDMCVTQFSKIGEPLPASLKTIHAIFMQHTYESACASGIDLFSSLEEVQRDPSMQKYLHPKQEEVVKTPTCDTVDMFNTTRETLNKVVAMLNKEGKAIPSSLRILQEQFATRTIESMEKDCADMLELVKVLQTDPTILEYLASKPKNPETSAPVSQPGMTGVLYAMISDSKIVQFINSILLDERLDMSYEKTVEKLGGTSAIMNACNKPWLQKLDISIIKSLMTNWRVKDAIKEANTLNSYRDCSARTLACVLASQLSAMINDKECSREIIMKDITEFYIALGLISKPVSASRQTTECAINLVAQRDCELTYELSIEGSVVGTLTSSVVIHDKTLKVYSNTY